MTYIIAVNNTPQANVTASFTLAGSGRLVEVIEEDRTVPIPQTGFSDVFGPYQTHVYKISDTIQ